MKGLISGSMLGSALWDFCSAFTPRATYREAMLPESRSTIGWDRVGLCCPFRL